MIIQCFIGETVNQAIKRYKKEIEIIEKELGKGKESKLPKWKRRKLMGEMEEGGDLVGAESSEDGKEEKRKDLDFWRGSFNSLLEVTGDLVTAGITGTSEVIIHNTYIYRYIHRKESRY